MIGIAVTIESHLGDSVLLGALGNQLTHLGGSGAVPACPVDLYSGDSKKVGVVRSAFATEGSWLGVALLKTRYATVGDLLEYKLGSAKIVRLFQVTLNETTGKG